LILAACNESEFVIQGIIDRRLIQLALLQLMEEFKRAHQKMFNSAQQKAQSPEQVPEKVRKRDNSSTRWIETLARTFQIARMWEGNGQGISRVSWK